MISIFSHNPFNALDNQEGNDSQLHFVGALSLAASHSHESRGHHIGRLRSPRSSNDDQNGDHQSDPPIPTKNTSEESSGPESRKQLQMPVSLTTTESGELVKIAWDAEGDRLLAATENVRSHLKCILNSRNFRAGF